MKRMTISPCSPCFTSERSRVLKELLLKSRMNRFRAAMSASLYDPVIATVRSGQLKRRTLLLSALKARSIKCRLISSLVYAVRTVGVGSGTLVCGIELTDGEGEGATGVLVSVGTGGAGVTGDEHPATSSAMARNRTKRINACFIGSILRCWLVGSLCI
jgi:hypothetical protein